MAGHGGQDLVAGALQHLLRAQVAQLGQLRQHRAGQRHRVAAGQGGRARPHRQHPRRQRAHVQPQRQQRLALALGHRDLGGRGRKARRDQQRLRFDGRGADAGLQPLIDDAFVRRMHVDDHQAVPILGQHIDAADLRDGAAQRPFVGRGQRGGRGCGGRGAGHAPRAGCLLRIQRGGGLQRQRTLGRTIAARHAHEAVGGGGRRQPGRHRRRSQRIRRRGRPARAFGFAGAIGRQARRVAHGGSPRQAFARPRNRQCALYRPMHRLVHGAAVAKAHLDLGRVHVHVHQLGHDGGKQHIGRLPVAVQHVFVGGAHAVGDQPVAHIAAVDEDVLLVGPRARQLGQCGAALDGQRPGGMFHRAAAFQKFFAQHVADALVQPRRAPLGHQLAFVPHRKAYVRACQRMAAHRFQRMGQLGAVALQELAAGWRVEEQLTHFHAGAHGAGGRAQLAGAGIQPQRMRRAGRAAEQRHIGHRGDGGQRLPAKAHGADRFQVVQRADLAGGMAAQCQRQLGRLDADAVVFHHDAAHAAGHQLDVDLRGAGIQRVVHQLAHHGSRALHHLAGGDLAHQLVGQLADRAAGQGGCRYG